MDQDQREEELASHRSPGGWMSVRELDASSIVSWFLRLADVDTVQALPANCCGLASSWHPFCSDPGAGLSIDGGAPRQDHIDAARAAARGVLNAWLAAQRVVPGRPAGLCAGCSRHDVSCFAAAQPKSRKRRSHARPVGRHTCGSRSCAVVRLWNCW